MKIKNILAVYTTPRTKEQKSTLQLVEKILNKHRISYAFAERDRLSKKQFKNKEMVIAIGGDGTFLRTSHFVDNQLLLGVNSDPKNKEGFFMKFDKKNFELEFKKVIEDKLTIRKFSRLEAWINDKKIGTYALNEFYIGSRKSYHSAKYIIKVGNKKEIQKSSGVLVTTPAGSYSWAKSCCGKSLPLNSKNFQFMVREPYEGKIFKNYKLIYGILNKNQHVEIISEMLDGVIVADSVSKEFNFKEGSEATIRLSNKKIRIIWR